VIRNADSPRFFSGFLPRGVGRNAGISRLDRGLSVAAGSLWSRPGPASVRL